MVFVFRSSRYNDNILQLSHWGNISNYVPVPSDNVCSKQIEILHMKGTASDNSVISMALVIIQGWDVASFFLLLPTLLRVCDNRIDLRVDNRVILSTCQWFLLIFIIYLNDSQLIQIPNVYHYTTNIGTYQYCVGFHCPVYINYFTVKRFPT